MHSFVIEITRSHGKGLQALIHFKECSEAFYVRVYFAFILLMLYPCSAHFVLVKPNFSNRRIASHIGKEQICSRLANLTILHYQLLETNLSSKTNTQLSNASITEVIETHIDDNQISISQNEVEVGNCLPAEAYIIPLYFEDLKV